MQELRAVQAQRLVGTMRWVHSREVRSLLPHCLPQCSGTAFPHSLACSSPPGVPHAGAHCSAGLGCLACQSHASATFSGGPRCLPACPPQCEVPCVRGALVSSCPLLLLEYPCGLCPMCCAIPAIEPYGLAGCSTCSSTGVYRVPSMERVSLVS